MTRQTEKRIAWLDIAKAITIFLVVFGHIIRGGVVRKMVYSFHVATFFLLSGMTCKTDRLKERMKNDFLRIMIPYYSFGLLSILIFLFLGKFAATRLGINVDTSLGKNLWDLLYACSQDGRIKFNMPLWFLPCLFSTKMLYYALHKLCRGKQISVLIGSLVLATLGFVYTYLDGPGLPFSFSVSLKMLAFFSLGRSIFPWLPTVKERYLASWKAYAFGIALFAVTVVVGCFAPAVDYAGDRFPNIVAFLITALTGSFGICAVSMGIVGCRILEYVGKRTLAILTMHKFPVLLFQTVGPLKTLLAQYDTFICVVFAGMVLFITVMLCLFAELIICRFFPYLLGDFSSFSRQK